MEKAFMTRGACMVGENEEVEEETLEDRDSLWFWAGDAESPSEVHSELGLEEAGLGEGDL